MKVCIVFEGMTGAGKRNGVIKATYRRVSPARARVVARAAAPTEREKSQMDIQPLHPRHLPAAGEINTHLQTEVWVATALASERVMGFCNEEQVEALLSS